MGLGSCNFFLIMFCLEAGSAKRKFCGFWHRWWAPLVSISVAPTVFSNLGTAACLLSAWAWAVKPKPALRLLCSDSSPRPHSTKPHVLQPKPHPHPGWVVWLACLGNTCVCHLGLRLPDPQEVLKVRFMLKVWMLCITCEPMWTDCWTSDKTLAGWSTEYHHGGEGFVLSLMSPRATSFCVNVRLSYLKQ